ncbi:MAG: hypothetical protein Q8O40_15775 [Chloroflexota bacterium]|nr:hypothetical protein [Chloroflexota bacterium]
MPKVIPESEKLQRYRAFWERASTDRPLIGTTINPMPSIRSIAKEGLLAPKDLLLEESLKEMEEEWQQWGEASGDAVWSASPIWAFHWLTALAGCRNARRGDIVWIGEGLHDWAQLPGVRFDRENPWFQRLAEFMQALARQSAGRYAVASPQLGQPADLLMHIRGPEKLAADLYDCPDKVAALVERCVDLSASAVAAAYELVPKRLGGYAGTIRYFWAPGQIVEMSEDVTIIMSPASHRKWVAPIHKALGSRYPYNILHLHSCSLHTVDNVLEIEEVTAVEITPDFGADMRPHVPLLKRILERKPLLIHGVMDIEEMKDLRGALPARGLALFCRCSTPAEAEKVLDALL